MKKISRRARAAAAAPVVVEIAIEPEVRPLVGTVAEPAIGIEAGVAGSDPIEIAGDSATEAAASSVAKPKAKPKPKTKPAAREEPAPEPVDLAAVRAELSELTARINYERSVRCFPGEDFPLDSAMGRLIRADIDRICAASPMAAAGLDEFTARLVELRDVCRRLLAEVQFGDAPGRREPAGRIAARAAQPRPPREYYPCLDGPVPPEHTLAGAADSEGAGKPGGILAAMLSTS